MDSDVKPPMPSKPHPDDCCGSGCTPCIFDVYEKDMEKWRKACELGTKIDFSTSDGNDSGCLFPDRFTEFELIGCELCSSNSFIFTFEMPKNKSLQLKVGDHVIIRQLVGESYISRPYTPISDITETRFLRFIIKVYPNGKMSQAIEKWQIGQLVPIRGPFGNLKYTANKYRRMLMLAAGTGIAPMYQIIKSVIQNEDDDTIINLLYSSSSFGSILLRKELLEITSYWNFNLVHYLSRENSLESKKYNEFAHLRKIEKVDVEDEIKSDTRDLFILICGTNTYEKDMLNACKNVEVADTMIHRF